MHACVSAHGVKDDSTLSCAEHVLQSSELYLEVQEEVDMPSHKITAPTDKGEFCYKSNGQDHPPTLTTIWCSFTLGELCRNHYRV